MYQDTVWQDANNTIRDGGGLRQVSDGVLVDGKYPGALLISAQNYGYGFFECYAKIPAGYVWPAFFLYDERRDDVTVPKNEIDVFEWLGTGIIYMTTHLSNTENYQLTQNWANLSDAYHKWGCYWDTDAVRIYLDDHLIGSFTQSQVPTATMRIEIAHTFGGWAPAPTNVTWPCYFDVDWVKVWTKVNR